MSISEAAKKIEIARKTMNDYLEGISIPNSMTLAAICRVLKVSAIVKGCRHRWKVSQDVFPLPILRAASEVSI